jgi:1,2-phenylacetyl-CoA epoxidase PaaB subunit
MTHEWPLWEVLPFAASKDCRTACGSSNAADAELAICNAR